MRVRGQHDSPLWLIKRKLLGRAATISASTLPVMENESKVRKATETPSNAPDAHSTRKSARFVDLGTTMSAISPIAAHVECALWWRGHHLVSDAATV